MQVIVSYQLLVRTFDIFSIYSAWKVKRSANVYLPKEQTVRKPWQKLVYVFSVCVYIYIYG
jgi:hypothetical protein